MTERTRVRLFLVPCTIFFLLFLTAARNLPPWGEYRGPYGDRIAELAVYERHATDTVNAINYDYRAFDTLGEEFILFTSVLGVMLLLRRDHLSPANQSIDDRATMSETIRTVTVPAVLLTTVFGFYIALHGQLSPGGGFQGGVILATAAWLVYIAVNLRMYERLTSHTVTEVVEAIGAGGYALIGLMPLAASVPLLTNVLPLGKTGDVFSSGSIALISACVGVEVTASFLLVSYTYLQEIIAGEIGDN